MTLSPELAREALRRQGGGEIIDFRNSYEVHKEVHLTFLLDVRRRNEELWEKQLVSGTSAPFFMLTVTLNAQFATSTMCLCNSKRDM